MPTVSTPVVETKPARVNLTIYQGDTPTYSGKLQNAAVDPDPPVAINLTGMTLRAQVRVSPESRTILFSFVVVQTNPTEGEFTFTVPAEGSAILPLRAAWDLEMVDSAGVIRTVLAGTVTSPRQVTRV